MEIFHISEDYHIGFEQHSCGKGGSGLMIDVLLFLIITNRLQYEPEGVFSLDLISFQFSWQIFFKTLNLYH